MAGIGFNLQKILENDTYFASFKAYFYSAVIAAGPWILSILTLFSLTYFAPDNISLYEVMSFRGVIIYIFAFSLIAVGLFQFPLTRYLADRLFLGERETVLPVFNAAALVLVVMQLASGLLYVALGEGDWHTGILAVMVYIAVSMIWLCMIFLSALKAYRTIAASYLAGSALAIGSSLVLGHERGLDGYLLGYLAGHLLIVVLWSARLYREFRSPYLFDFQFLSFTWKNKRLMATGFLYALGIWIDKIVFWLSPQATQVAPLLRLMPLYDSATFLAYLTMIPSLCLFLVQVETDFYRGYRRFYHAILGRAVYSRIQKVKAEIAGSLRNGAGILVSYQGVLTLAAVVYAPAFAEALKFPLVQVPVFRVLAVGVFLHSLFLAVLLIILYFDFKGVALFSVAVFCLSNLVLTYLTTWLPMPFYGYGYLFSCLLALVVAFYLLDFNLKRLEYLTFASQPVGVHREEEVS